MPRWYNRVCKNNKWNDVETTPISERVKVLGVFNLLWFIGLYNKCILFLTSRYMQKCFCGCRRWSHWKDHDLADKQWSHWSSVQGTKSYQTRPAEISTRQNSAAVCTVSYMCCDCWRVSDFLFVLVKDLSLFTNRTWRKLKKVMRKWLQTTGIGADTEERDSIIQEVNEVFNNIHLIHFCTSNWDRS